MNVSISQRNLERIKRKVASGRYSSLDDVLDDALALLDERDSALEWELADTKEKLLQGLAEAKSGQSVPAEQVFQELRRRNADAGKNRL